MQLALKVDVDTYAGMRDGVPNLLQLFQKLKIRASFFVPFGPDESGKALFRIFKKKGFLKKMFRTNALRLYGIKTMLRGTLLPAPNIGASFPEIVHEILKNGHELGIHGYNHVLWQDHLLEMTGEEVRQEIEKGISGYEKIVGGKPCAFAAPAWLCTSKSLMALDEFHFSYASDTRGAHPFYPVMNGKEFKTLQIPSTLPTIDEILGWNNINEMTAHATLSSKLHESNAAIHVHSIHTEVEGTALFDAFSKWLTALKKENVTFVTLAKITANLLNEPQKIPKCEIVLSEIPGRSGLVSCQRLC